MKLLRCNRCGDVLALTPYQTRQCECGVTFGRYNFDRDTVRISAAADCHLYGLHNRVFIYGRGEAWRYDESNGKVTRVETYEECIA